MSHVNPPLSLSRRFVTPCTQGIIAGLDRRYFSVSLFCIVNANMYLSEEVMAAADTVHHVPLAREEAKRVRIGPLHCF